MPQSPQIFREFGIIPDRVASPSGTIRAYFSWGHVIGQYIATGLLLLFGSGLAVLFAFTLPWPVNLLAAVAGLAMFAAAAYFVGRNDYVSIELDGETIRAKHLYTGRITSRSVREIDELITLVLQVQNLTTTIVNAWLGRVRGVEIRFRDGRWPIRISRVDPKMINAQELTEAIVYRMSQIGELDADVADVQGSPLIRRIYWIAPPQSIAEKPASR